MADLHVEVVSAERTVWSGEARSVVAKTTDGDLGVLPGHEPVLAVLQDGVVRVRTTDGDEVRAAVHGGFLSVSDAGVSVLAEIAELADDIDVERARQALSSAQGAGSDDEETTAARRRAEARLNAAGANG